MPTLYWFRSETLWMAFAWLATAAFWLAGGWLVARHAFNLAARERFILGTGIGLGLYLWLVNALGRWLPSVPAYILPAGLVFGLGLVYTYHSGRPLLDKADLKVWPYGLVWVGLTVLFQRLAMGMAVFDEQIS